MYNCIRGRNLDGGGQWGKGAPHTEFGRKRNLQDNVSRVLEWGGMECSGGEEWLGEGTG